jgi:hypothetical protein
LSKIFPAIRLGGPVFVILAFRFGQWLFANGQMSSCRRLVTRRTIACQEENAKAKLPAFSMGYKMTSGWFETRFEASDRKGVE